MRNYSHERFSESWFRAESQALELLYRGGLCFGGDLDSRAAREVLTLTMMLTEEDAHVCGDFDDEDRTARLVARLRHRIRNDELWQNWCAGRLLTMRGPEGPSLAHARRSWWWLTRERTVLIDRVWEEPVGPGDAWASLSRLSIWELGLLRARMSLDVLLLAQAGATGVIGSVVILAEGATEAPAGTPGVVIEAVWGTDALLMGTDRQVTALRVVLPGGSTAEVAVQQLISLSKLSQ